MSCRARDRPWEPRAWGGEGPRPAWLQGPRVGSTRGAAPRETHSYWCVSEGAGSHGYGGCEPHDLPAACNGDGRVGEPVAKVTWRINCRTWR